MAAPQQNSNKFDFVFGLHNIWLHGAKHEWFGCKICWDSKSNRHNRFNQSDL